MVLATFFISLPVDVTDAIRLMYLMEEESYKRRDDFMKFTNSILSKTDQLRFIHDCQYIYANKEMGEAIANIRKENWKISEEEGLKAQAKTKPKEKKKGKKDKKEKENK